MTVTCTLKTTNTIQEGKSGNKKTRTLSVTMILWKKMAGIGTALKSRTATKTNCDLRTSWNKLGEKRKQTK